MMNEHSVTIIDADGEKHLKTDGSETLLQLARANGAPVHAPCGGNGTCRQCRVSVTGPVRDFDGNRTQCRGEELLACRYYPAGSVTIRLKNASGERVVAQAQDIAPGRGGLGLAVDIGTTTVAAFLYDLSSGKCLGTAGGMNAQRGYGSDVISRIQYCADEAGLARLAGVIREQIASLASRLSAGLASIDAFSIAGNTVMEHIFAGLSPVSIGVAPFAPLSLFGETYAARDYFPAAKAESKLYLCPAVAGYVGGDITAGLMSSGAYKSEKTVLFIDIGTNGEMALGSRDGFVCCATAAGPAFEGAEIECGSPANDGAINSVSPDLTYTVLGGAAPKSICGSGIIDAVAAMLCREIIDETGRMEEEKHFFSEHVYISGLDVRQIQLAKAAIRAGIETLLSSSGLKYADIGEVLIAGGFGAYMNVKSACVIGLLPPALMGRTRHVGNSAGTGASMALDPDKRRLLAEITSKCKYLELSSSAVFNSKYIDAMMFDEWDEVYDD